MEILTVNDSGNAFGKTCLFGFVFLCIEILMIATLIPGNYVYKYIVKENEVVLEKLGEEMYLDARETSQQWYYNTMVDTDIENMVATFFIPTEEEVARSEGLEDMGSETWFPWISERGEIVRAIFHQMFQRAYLTTLWLPLLLLMVIPAFIDGLCTWKIRQYSFDYPSPIAHRYASHIVIFVLLGSVMLLLAPVPISPIIVPMLWMVVIPVSIILIVSNMPKKM